MIWLWTTVSTRVCGISLRDHRVADVGLDEVGALERAARRPRVEARDVLDRRVGLEPAGQLGAEVARDAGDEDPPGAPQDGLGFGSASPWAWASRARASPRAASRRAAAPRSRRAGGRSRAARPGSPCTSSWVAGRALAQRLGCAARLRAPRSAPRTSSSTASCARSRAALRRSDGRLHRALDRVAHGVRHLLPGSSCGPSRSQSPISSASVTAPSRRSTSSPSADARRARAPARRSAPRARGRAGRRSSSRRCSTTTAGSGATRAPRRTASCCPIQATGMGGPSAAIVIEELIVLGRARRSSASGPAARLDRRPGDSASW